VNGNNIEAKSNIKLWHTNQKKITVRMLLNTAHMICKWPFIPFQALLHSDFVYESLREVDTLRITF
jgi:hypothetical protein